MSGPRICVLGAGPGGLSAAWYLAKRGYSRVTVLESSDRVGGKCHTVTHEGRAYDLGATSITLAYTRTLEIAAEVGAATHPQPKRLGVRWDEQPPAVGPLLDSMLKRYPFTELTASSVRYLAQLARYQRALGGDGFGGVAAHPELMMPFAAWARKHRMEPLVEMFQLTLTDMGYGRLDELPAAYVIKYMNLLNVATMGVYLADADYGWPRRFWDGWERMWTRVAWRLDVRCGARVTRITRDAGLARVAWTDAQGEAREETFDRLIVACPLDATAAFMDLRDDEHQLAEAVRYDNYWVTIARTRGIPMNTLNTLRGLRRAHCGELRHPWPDSDHSIFYAPDAGDADGAAVLANLREDVADLFPAAVVEDPTQQICWRYFPHVSPEAFAAGFYDRLEARQGRDGTYVAGALPAFETVEHVVSYSRGLVGRFFPRLGRAP